MDQTNACPRVGSSHCLSHIRWLQDLDVVGVSCIAPRVLRSWVVLDRGLCCAYVGGLGYTDNIARMRPVLDCSPALYGTNYLAFWVRRSTSAKAEGFMGTHLEKRTSSNYLCPRMDSNHQLSQK
jgi:hypothetical protein